MHQHQHQQRVELHQHQHGVSPDEYSAVVEEAERVRGEARIALGQVRFQLESVANQAQAEILQSRQVAQARVDAVQSEAQAAVGQLQAQSSEMQSEAHAIVNQLQSQNVALQSQNEHLTEQNKALSLQLQSQALKIKEQESFSNQLHQQLVALQGLVHAAEPPPTPVPKASIPAEQAASASSQNGAELVDALKALAGEVGGTMRRIEQTIEVALSPNASPKRKAKAKAKAKTIAAKPKGSVPSLQLPISPPATKISFANDAQWYRSVQGGSSSSASVPKGSSGKRGKGSSPVPPPPPPKAVPPSPVDFFIGDFDEDPDEEGEESEGEGFEDDPVINPGDEQAEDRNSAEDYESSVYKFKDLKDLRLPQIPASSIDFRAYRNSILTQIASIDRTGKSVLLNWLKKALDPLGSVGLVAELQANSESLPRLDAWLSACLCEAKALKGDWGLQAQSYLERAHAAGTMPSGRALLALLSRRYRVDKVRGPLVTVQSLFDLEPESFSIAGLTSFKQKVEFVLNGLPADQWPAEGVMFSWIYSRLKPCRLLSRVIERVKESKKTSRKRSFAYIWSELDEILAEAREDSNEQALKDSLKPKAKDPPNPKAAPGKPDKPNKPKGAGKTKGQPGHPKDPPAPPPPNPKATPGVTDQGGNGKGKGQKAKEGQGKGKGDGTKGSGHKGKGKDQPSGPKKEQPSSKAKPKEPCFFFPKGTCTRGKDCPFSHEEPKAAAAAPKVPGGVALLTFAAGSGAAQARASSERSPNSSILRSTFQLATMPFRFLARCWAAISIALPATIPHVENHISANVSRTSGGSYSLEWVADSGAGRSLLSQSALADQGITPDAFQTHVCGVQPLQFETGNGTTSSSSMLTTSSEAFGQVESYVLQQCPVVRSVGQLVELQKKPFVWLPGHKPFFGLDPDSVQVAWSDRIVEADRVDDFVPVFREEIRFDGGCLASAAPTKATPSPVPAADRPVPEPGGRLFDPEPPSPADSLAGYEPSEGHPEPAAGVESESEPSRAQRLIAEAQSVQHRLTHLPKNPYCEICSRSKMLKRRTARVRFKEEADELAKVTEFGQRVAVDFIIVHKETTKDKESVVFVARDEATGYMRAYPLAARNADNVVRSLLSFIGKYSAGPCVICKSDQAKEILTACTTLGFTSEPSLERRWPHNAVLERELRTLEEATRALHLGAGFQLHEGLWAHSVRYAAHTLNLYHPAVGIEGLRYDNAVGTPFAGQRLQLGQLIYYRLEPGARHKFGASAAPGIFVGWRLDTGPGSFREVYQVLDYHKLVSRDPGYQLAVSVPREELHVPSGPVMLPLHAAAEVALSQFTAPEYEALGYLEIPFSVVSPETSAKKRHEYITLDRLIKHGVTPGCRACKFETTTHTPVCKARFDGLIKADKVAASRSVKGSAPPTVERPDESGVIAPATPDPPAAAPASDEAIMPEPASSSNALPDAEPSSAAVAPLKPQHPVFTPEFIEKERARNHCRRVENLPGKDMLIEYACDDDSEIGFACERHKVHCLRLTRSTLDLESRADVEQVASQVVPGIDVWISIECTHFSSWQAMNLHRHGPKYAKKLAERQASTRRMLSHALQIADHVVALHGRVSIEWPQNAGTWQLPEVIAFLERHNMQKVVCHGCSFGLRGKQHPLKKPWIIASNDSRVLTHFAKRTCTGDHLHESIEGSLTKPSGHYPASFADLVIESLYPQKYFKSQPSISLSSTSALLTRNLTKKEWLANPDAVAAVEKEAMGLRENGTWDDESVTTLHKLRADARAKGKKLRVAEILTLCGIKHAELSAAEHRLKGRIVYRGDRVLDENNQLVFFSETSTNPTALTALNACLWYGCLPNNSVSCSDAIQAYLQSELKEETYVVLPRELWLPGWAERFGIDAKLVVRLRKSLYGHPQAGRLWQEYLSRILVSLHGKESSEFPSNWTFEYQNGIIILNIYVDDLTLCGPSSLHSAFWSELRKRVKLDPEAFVDSKGIRILGRLHCISTVSGKTVLTMNMVEYAGQVVDSYCELTGIGIEQLKKVQTPSLPESAMTEEDIATQGQLHESASKVLMKALWLSRLCRADIAFAVGRLATRVTKWTAWEDRQILRLVSYIHHTRGVCMHSTVSGEGPAEIHVFTDSDLASCPHTAKSTSGIVVQLVTGAGHFPVMWQSKKQTSVARSTPEAECIAMASALFGDVINLQTFLQGALRSPVPVKFYQDNQTVLKILETGYSAKLRHLPRVHKVNIASMSEIFEDPEYSAEYIRSNEQVANGLTKIIAPIEWGSMLEQLCLSTVPPVPATVSQQVIFDAEQYARGIPTKVSAQDIVQLLTYLPGEEPARGQLTATSKCFTTGAFAHGGGVAGLRQNTLNFPIATGVLCRFFRKMLPKHRFTAVSISQGLIVHCHKDRFNEPGSLNAVIPLTQFRDGRIWIESPEGTVPCPDGIRDLFGSLLPWPASFDPKLLHCTSDSPDAKHRIVLIGFTPRNFHLLDTYQKITLSEVGFPI